MWGVRGLVLIFRRSTSTLLGRKVYIGAYVRIRGLFSPTRRIIYLHKPNITYSLGIFFLHFATIHNVYKLWWCKATPTFFLLPSPFMQHTKRLRKDPSPSGILRISKLPLIFHKYISFFFEMSSPFEKREKINPKRFLRWAVSDDVSFTKTKAIAAGRIFSVISTKLIIVIRGCFRFI